ATDHRQRQIHVGDREHDLHGWLSGNLCRRRFHRRQCAASAVDPMNRRGSVAVEAALALGLVLVPLLLALSDLGLALSVQMRLERANQAALFYAWGTSGASVASIKSAASAGYGVSDPSFA